MDFMGSFQFVKRQVLETDHLLPSSAEVTNNGLIPPLHQALLKRGA
jgi:hypothetical protein